MSIVVTILAAAIAAAVVTLSVLELAKKPLVKKLRSELAPELPAMIMRVVGVVPAAVNPGDAGLDLRYDPDAKEAVILLPGERKLFPSGTKVALPAGTVGFVCPRSGLTAKHGVTVLNAPGVLDSGYRGDVGVNLINLGREPFAVVPGARIAQLVITPFISPSIAEVGFLDSTERGEQGHGSTGTV